jgi:hypothetical protein
MDAFASAAVVTLAKIVQLHRHVVLLRTAAVMDPPLISMLPMDAFAIAQTAFPMQLVQLHHLAMPSCNAVVMVPPQT